MGLTTGKGAGVNSGVHCVDRQVFELRVRSDKYPQNMHACCKQCTRRRLKDLITLGAGSQKEVTSTTLILSMSDDNILSHDLKPNALNPGSAACLDAHCQHELHAAALDGFGNLDRGRTKACENWKPPSLYLRRRSCSGLTACSSVKLWGKFALL